MLQRNVEKILNPRERERERKLRERETETERERGGGERQREFSNSQTVEKYDLCINF